MQGGLSCLGRVGGGKLPLTFLFFFFFKGYLF